MDILCFPLKLYWQRKGDGTVENPIRFSPSRLVADAPHPGAGASQEARARFAQEIQRARSESRFFRSQALAEIKAVRYRRHDPDHGDDASLPDLRLYLRMRRKWQCHLRQLEKRVRTEAGSLDPLPRRERIDG
jgi:hypothetical protein